jgi:hypothetical protein
MRPWASAGEASVRPIPVARGRSPVNIDACDGSVQLAAAYMLGAAVPRAASCAIVGVAPAPAPYGSSASARAVSRTTQSTFGCTTASVWKGVSRPVRLVRMEATSAPQRRLSVGDVINETFSIYGQQILPLIGSAIVVFVVVGIVAGILEAAGGIILALVASIVQLAGHALYVGFVVRLVEDVRDGRRDQTIGDLFSAAAPSILSLIVFGILFGIGVAIGLVLIIVPGLILITFWSVGAPSIVAEGLGPLEAFGRSWRLVRGNAWSVFGTLVVVLLIVIAIGIVLGVIATPIGNGATVVASIISGAITAPIFALAVSVMFFDLGGGRVSEAPTAAAPPPPPAPSGA